MLPYPQTDKKLKNIKEKISPHNRHLRPAGGV
jgi:hypothetical protein